MSEKLEVVTVPKELYYHEAAYVRRLEALVEHGKNLADLVIENLLEKEENAIDYRLEYNRHVTETQQRFLK